VGSKQYQKRQKHKEQYWIDFISQKFGEPTTLDKPLDSNCGKERPDITYDCKTHLLAIEIDENQHRSYEDCENTRMKNIYYSAGYSHVVFLRINPDNFRVKGKPKVLTELQRQEIVSYYIAHYKSNPPKYNLSVLYLFYDEFDKYTIQEEQLEAI
jgi:very-short-patch-repair endonuclease